MWPESVSLENTYRLWKYLWNVAYFGDLKLVFLSICYTVFTHYPNEVRYDYFTDMTGAFRQCLRFFIPFRITQRHQSPLKHHIRQPDNMEEYNESAMTLVLGKGLELNWLPRTHEDVDVMVYTRKVIPRLVFYLLLPLSTAAGQFYCSWDRLV